MNLRHILSHYSTIYYSTIILNQLPKLYGRASMNDIAGDSISVHGSHLSI